MLDLTNKEVLVIGLGGRGRAACELLRRNGARVTGVDSSDTSALRDDAERLRPLGVEVELGVSALPQRQFRLAVVSPTVPTNEQLVRAVAQSKVPIIGELELGYQQARCLSIAIAGTNGKGTTAELVERVLTNNHRKTVLSGHRGRPVCSIVEQTRELDYLILQVNSFQLELTEFFRPAVAVLMNLAPDHLDRYATAEEYYADKARLFRNADAESAWVVNGDDEAVMRMVEHVAGHKFEFSLKKEAEGYMDAQSGQLMVLGAPLLARSDLPLLGQHNVANTLAATLAVMAADRSHQTQTARKGIVKAIESFRSLPHRLELVGEYGGVQWINDSKATNVSSTAVAIDGMERPTVLLLGGRHKGEAYTPLAESVKRKVKRVIAYGEAASIIAKDLRPVVDVVRLGSDFGEVVRAARAAARAGEAVLLSPACSSYDMFSNYEERGERFRELAAMEA